jgi:hypothetical protein
MGKRKKVPEDLMGTILGGGYTPSKDEQTSSEAPDSRDTGRGTASPTSAGENNISWEPRPERMGITFNLSKQVSRELDRLRLELQLDEDIRASNSEIAELALRIAIEDARKRGKDSKLLRSLSKDPEDQPEKAIDETRSMPAGATVGSGRTVERSVYGPGYILETTYSEQREVVTEKMVGNVADLPVEEEYLDKEGRLLSLAKDELGNTFERVTDEESNTLGARLVREAD